MMGGVTDMTKQMNDRERFIKNYYTALGLTLNPNKTYNQDMKFYDALIGSIYGLQQQVNDLQDQLDKINGGYEYYD